MYTYKIHSHLIQIFRCTREPNQKKQWKQFNSSLASGLKETRQISESRDFLHRFLWRLQLTTTKSKLYLGKLETRRLATKTPTQSKLVLRGNTFHHQRGTTIRKTGISSRLSCTHQIIKYGSIE